jgi:hypothetical protein
MDSTDMCWKIYRRGFEFFQTGRWGIYGVEKMGLRMRWLSLLSPLLQWIASGVRTFLCVSLVLFHGSWLVQHLGIFLICYNKCG